MTHIGSFQSQPKIMDYMLNKLILILAISLIAGCASSAKGPAYNDYIQQEIIKDPNKASVTVLRPDTGIEYSARDASLKLNGSELGKCAHRGFCVFEVEPGSYKLSVDIWDVPGNCIIPISLNKSTSYFYEIRARDASMASGLMLGLIGQAIESSGKSCGGAFSIYEIDENIAKSKLRFLKLSE